MKTPIIDAVYLHNCRAKINADLSAFRAIGPYLDDDDREWFETYYFNNLVVAMDHMFPNNGAPYHSSAYTVATLSHCILAHKAIYAGKNLDLPHLEISYQEGQPISFSESSLLRLAKAFFLEMESQYDETTRRL